MANSTTWLHEIAGALADAGSGLLEPSEAVKEGEHDVAEASIELRQIYRLAMRWAKAGGEVSLTAAFSPKLEDRVRHTALAASFHGRSKVLMDAFWIAVKDAHGLWDKPCIGIRAGWKIVWSEELSNPVTALLESIIARG